MGSIVLHTLRRVELGEFFTGEETVAGSKSFASWTRKVEVAGRSSMLLALIRDEIAFIDRLHS